MGNSQTGGHPLENVMKTSMENLNLMVDVNKIVGDAVETPDGYVIIPISRMTFGFVAGGSDFDSDSTSSKNGQQNNQQNNITPFGGGSGGGITVQPVAFLVVGHGEIRLLPVETNATVDRLLDIAPTLIEQLQEMFFKERKAPSANHKK